MSKQRWMATILGTVLIAGCGGSDDGGGGNYNYDCTCTAQCDGNQETITVTECGEPGHSREIVDQGVASCQQNLAGQCAEAARCECSCIETNTGC